MNLIRRITAVLLWISLLSTGECQKGRKRDMMEDIQKTVNLIWTSIERHEQKVSTFENSMTLMSNRVEKIIDWIDHNKLNNKLLEERLERLDTRIRSIEDSMNFKTESLSENVEQIKREVNRIDSETDGKLRKIMNIMSDTYQLSKDVSIIMNGRSTPFISNGDNEDSQPIEDLQKKVLEQMSILETSLTQQITNVAKLSKQALSGLDNVNLEMISVRDECQTQRQSQSDTRGSQLSSLYPTVKSEHNCRQCSDINATELKNEIESQIEQIGVKVENELTVIESKIQELMTTCHTSTNPHARSIPALGTPPLIVNISSQIQPTSGPSRKSIAPVDKQTRTDNCRHTSDLLAPKHCQELHTSGANCDGVYIVHIANTRLLRVYCDMNDNGGGWTVILRRGDFGGRYRPRNRISFEQDWNAYKDGFGDVDSGEFWLGLDNIYQLTVQSDQMLQVDLEAFDGDYVSVVFDSFRIGSETDNYRLHLGNAIQSNSTVAQALIAHNTSMFSTYDRNNNIISQKDNCAQKLKGGWWFHNCHSALLTAPYFTKSARKHIWQGMQWHSWKQMDHLKAAQMKIRAKV